jgi:nucleotide-binding universal stress UspA family protein
MLQKMVWAGSNLGSYAMAEEAILVLGANSQNRNSGLGATADQVSSYCPCTVLIARQAA